MDAPTKTKDALPQGQPSEVEKKGPSTPPDMITKDEAEKKIEAEGEATVEVGKVKFKDRRIALNRKNEAHNRELEDILEKDFELDEGGLSNAERDRIGSVRDELLAQNTRTGFDLTEKQMSKLERASNNIAKEFGLEVIKE